MEIVVTALRFVAVVGKAAASVVGVQLATSTVAGVQAALAIGSAVIAGTAVLANKAMAMFQIEMPKVDSDASRQRTVKSTTEPYKIVYGETLVSGPISYIGMKGTNNEDLYHVIALAGHEVTDITDIYFDNELISNSAINSGSSSGGNVTSGIFGPRNSTTICIINKHLGTATQAADSMMVNAFTDYTSAHQGKGIAYIAMKWKLNEDSAEVWDKYAPTDIKAIVKGRKVYDPRLEYAAVGTYGQDVTNASYIAYSTNPALCLADYLINADFGMGIASSKIDWEAIVTAANGCDVSVAVPNGTEKRFTVSGVLFGTDSHRRNITKILSSMNGSLVYSNGKYVLRAGIYEAPTESLNEDDLIGAIGIKTSFERSDRFNTIKGLFVDPAQNHKSSEFPKVQLANAVSRDNGEVLEKEVQYPMTNSSYMAQRLSNKLIQLSDQQKVVSFPANLSALRITAGDRVQVSVDELSWSNKVFMCVGWTFSDEGGVNLTLREDSSTSYADPAANEYSTITATGDITDAFRGVPSPSGLSVTAGLKNNELNWVNPARPADYGTIYVYASPNGNFSSAVKIGETDGTQFIHDASNSADSVSAGDVRYYWVRAVKNVGTDAASQSNLEPNADPNTTVFATVGRVNWADVSGSTNAPADNATVGAQISVNLYDTDGSTVMNQADVKNSVLAQEILQVEVEAGEVLDLETGQDVDIQNLGDVAIFVSDSNQTLNSSINTVAQNLSSLEDTVVDLTSGVSDIYIQTTAPVAGVGGIPDPIPTFSRWYDSDDNNHPYYWTGSAWVSLKDAQISQNATAITNLQTSLATTNGNVTSNASAISVLDATTVSQGNSITSITSDVTALETTVNNASTGVAANATGLSNLTTRVTTAEGSITTNASDITTLNTNVAAANTNITTNATAISGLDTRVTTAEGTITTQSSDITALESTVNNGTTGVAANASGLSALTTRVSTAEGAITTNSSAVTTLDATYTEDLHFRTEVEDENDDLIDLETSGTVQLQDLSDFVSGSSSAIDSLTVQTYVNEDNIQTQAIQLTALESTVNDPTNGVVATAGALSNLTTEVSVIDGVVTSTAQDLTTLTTTVGGNTASITTQANSINGVEANYSVKIDNNNRITGFGLLSTTAGSTPFSEFAVVADQFSIVSPDSTSDTPIQPFTVTADKIYFGADVVVSGDLISTGTISADRLQIDGVMFDTETVGGVTSLIIKESGVNTSQIAESAITTARLSNDAVTVDKFANTLQSTNYVADTSGWQILTSGDVEFQNAKITGDIVAETLTVTEANITGTLTLGGGVLQDGSGNNLTTITTLNANQTFAEVSGASAFYRITTNTATAPTNAQFDTEAGRFAKVNDIVITTDTTTTPDTTYGWTCTAAGTASTEATWEEITDFISGDLLVDGTITADQIAANTITANEIVSNAIGTGQLTVGVGTTLGLADTASQVNAGLALLLNKDTFGNFNTGEASLVSVDKDGNPILEDANTTSNGFIQWNGSKITVEAAQHTDSATLKFTVLTNLVGKRGFIVFDTTKSDPFTVDGATQDVAFAYKEADQWYYDNNSNTATTFTPSNDMVALGYLETGTADQILKGGLINPVTLTAAAFPSDEIKSGSIGGVLITPTTIESNFVTGVSGFQLKSDGTLEAGNGTFRGAITATSGSIANSVTVGGTAASTVATGAQVGSTGGFVSVVKPSFGHFDGLTTTDIFTQSLQGTTATRSFDTTIFRVGTQAIKQNGATGGVGFYSPVGSLDLIPSRKYMMTFWVRATTTDGVWSVGIHDGSSLYGAVGTALTAANTWEFKAAIVDLSASTSSTGYYRIFNNNFTSGSAYFDAISIFDITDATSVTTTNVSQTYFSPLAQAVAVDTDKVNGTAASTISAGAIAGASAIQDNDTGLTLGLQAGSAGPVTISYTAASGSDPEVAKLYQGTGTFNNSNTGFYLDNSGNFSLQDKLAFNGSTLAVSGTVNASAGAFTGDVSTDSKFVAGSGATSATMDGADANYKFYAGASSAGDSPFKVDTSGTVTADRIIITRPDDPSAIIFDSAQDGLVGIGLSSISSESDNAVAEIGYELTSNTDNVRLISSSNSNTTLRVLFPLGYAPFSITSEEDFPDSITLKFQIATVTGGVVGTFSDISNGSKTFTRRVYSSAAPSDDDYYSVYSSGTAWYVKGKDAVDGQFNLSFSKTFVTNNIDAAYRVQVSFVAGSGSGSGNPNTSASRTIYFTNDTQYFTIDSNDIIRDQAAGSTVTGDVILSGSSGTRSIIWRDSDDLDENWAIEAYVDSSESNSNTMFFKYNNATSTPFSFVGDTGNLLILGDFYSGLGAVTTATASFGGGYGNTGISIDNAGNYQGNGNITIDGTLSQGSDIRLKSNVETIDGSKVFDMRGVSFVKNGEKGAGVIAQELQEIAPELVKEGSDGMLSVAYGDLIGYLIESVKTLKDEIDQIKADQS